VSNALVPVAHPDQDPTVPVAGRPHADFIAHLIATSVLAPQTRVRRRADPDQAAAAYGALDRLPPSTGKTLSRFL
jgi:hypothetical protein